jgi:cell division protein FtsL
MNAAARLVHHNVIARHLLLSFKWSKEQLIVLVLAISVLLSGMSIIYVTQMSRTLRAVYHQQINERNQLHIQESQLMLERSTWIQQTRIQHIAETKLNMLVPATEKIVIVHE